MTSKETSNLKTELTRVTVFHGHYKLYIDTYKIISE